MRKIITIIVIGFLIIFGSFFLFRFLLRENKFKNFKIINYQLQNKDYKLLEADTPQKWERGLMYFRKLDGVDGMIFIFPDKESRTFWNKNTFMDLELLWLDDDKVVGKSSLLSIEKSKEVVTVSSPKEVNKVIEIPMKDRR